MKILVITQKVDKNDPVLGFFHEWLKEFAKHFKFITVICLGKGEYNLPANVEVLSLGKERGVSKIAYLFNFYRYIWQKRAQYSHIFVHMNQEYVLLAGDLWRLWGKRIYLWRNHAKGNIITDMAVLLSHKVFYTSPSSYTAKFKKSVQMPVGIDTDFFRPNPRVQRVLNSYLFLGRIAPVKKVLEFVKWFNNLEGYSTATIAGTALPKDKDYEGLVQSEASEKIKFIGAVTREQARNLYQSHETYVNFTPAGSFDKTILEAAACGAKIIVRNPDFKTDFKIEEHSLKTLMDKLNQYF